MYAKDSLMDMNCAEIIRIFKEAHKKGIIELTIPYLLKNTDIRQLDVYDAVHKLIFLKILDIIEYSICPYCSTEEIYKENSRKLCSRCRRNYVTDNTIEKLKIISKDII